MQDYRQRMVAANRGGPNAAGGNIGAAFAARRTTQPVRVPVTDHQIWIQAFDKVLTDKQKKSYADSIQSRTEFRHQAVVTIAMGLIDEQLELDAKQRQELTKLAHRLLNENVMTTPPNWNIQTISSQVILPELIRQFGKETEAVLTEAQRVAWSDYSARYARIRTQYLKPKQSGAE